MNPATCRPGEVIESGEYCDVVLAVDQRGLIPVQKEFFASKAVGREDSKKMVAALRNHARHGPSPSSERYERIAGIDYIKIHGFRAFCFERVVRGRRELIVCHIEPKKRDKALPDTHRARAKARFAHHCERYPT